MLVIQNLKRKVVGSREINDVESNRGIRAEKKGSDDVSMGANEVMDTKMS